MTPRLALVENDANDGENVGDDQAPALSLEEQLATSIVDALTKRWRSIEKRLDRLENCPEIAASLARMDNRKLYT